MKSIRSPGLKIYSKYFLRIPSTESRNFFRKKAKNHERPIQYNKILSDSEFYCIGLQIPGTNLQYRHKRQRHNHINKLYRGDSQNQQTRFSCFEMDVRPDIWR